MRDAGALRQQIETTLRGRASSEALSPRLRVELARTACGIATLDALLGGGLPAGVITEAVGGACCGRTTLALAYAAAVMREGQVCAWVDVADALDPVTVAANGVDLARLLWVRCGMRQGAETIPKQAGLSGVGLPVGSTGGAQRHTGGGSPHPRSEGRDMPAAVSSLLQAHGGLYDQQMRRERKILGTPGAPNRPVTMRYAEREEQVNSDRMPARRGENLALTPRCAETLPRRIASLPSGNRLAVPPSDGTGLSGGFSRGKTWQAFERQLDQALRATDLLLQGGGFGAIVLDLGNTPPEAAWRVPLATWFRFRAACERSRVSLLLLTQHPCARSSAELVVRLEPGGLVAESRVMTGVRYQAAAERSRTAERAAQDGLRDGLRDGARVVPIRKPPQPERPGGWRSDAAWARAGGQTG